MKNNIAKFTLNHIKKILITFFVIGLISIGNCAELNAIMLSPTHQKIKLHFALTKKEQLKGLSGLKSNDFNTKEGMLFVNKEMGPRKFWMPDTFFDLDIIFLDSNLKIVGIEKSVKAHPGMQEPPEIQKTETYTAQFVLETISGSSFSKNLKMGDLLKLESKTTLLEIVSRTHLEQ
jgi:uncharacterized membrane protein (UPF0127 family)